MKHCRVHTDEVASPDCEGWRVDDLCDRCLHALGYPSQEPLWGEVHRVSHELLGFSNAHPEAIAYALHFMTPALRVDGIAAQGHAGQ